MIAYAIVQARLADLHDQARRDALARDARRARGARRRNATHRATAGRPHPSASPAAKGLRRHTGKVISDG
jgi:hypothetical protein